MSDTTWEINLDSSDPEQRRLGVAALSQASGPSVPPLVIRALGDEDWRVRKEAITVVAELGPSPELLDALLETFSTSDNVGLRNAVSEALAGFGRPAIQRIAQELTRLDADGRKLAAEALGRTGQAAAVGVLTELMKDNDTNVRVATIEALGAIADAQTEEVVELLSMALQSDELLERLAALEAINSLGIVVGWEQLAPLVGQPVLERAALTALARTSAPGVADLLVQALTRQAAIGEVWPVEALADYVGRSPEAMASARVSLGTLASEARIFLYRMTDSEELELRTAALIVLAALGDVEASRWVFDAAEREEFTGVADQLVGVIAGLHATVIEERLRGTAAFQRALVLRTAARFPIPMAADAVLEEVAHAIADEGEPVISAALELLASTSNERCFRLLVDRFVAWPTAIRRTAMLIIAEMTSRHPDVARDILDTSCFQEEAWIPATVMLAALARNGRATSSSDMELLTRCLLADQASVRCAALEALSVIGDSAAADAIAFSLADEEQEVRLGAVRALGRLRGEGESASVIGRLIDLAQRTDDRDLLVVAVQAIGETSDPRVLAVLRPLIKSTEPSVAVAAVEAIGQVSDTRRIEALIDGLAHPDVDVVMAAMRMLAHEADVRVGAHLGACLDHDTWGVRRLAADLLGQRGSDAAGLLRAKRATEREPLVKEALERALGVLEGTQPTRKSAPAPGQGSWRPR